MRSTSSTKTLERIPPNVRKRLLKSNIRSLIEKSSMERIHRRKEVEEDLRRISSLEIVDPDIEGIESKKREQIARNRLSSIEKEIEQEVERILSDI